MKQIALDFEYCRSQDETIGLVCCAYALGDSEPVSVWLHNDLRAKEALRRKMEAFHAEGYTFVSFAWSAEARSLLSLGTDVRKLDAVDLYLLYRQMSNHWDETEYGRHLVKGGKVKFLLKPKKREYGQVVETVKVDGTRMSHSLSSAIYKFLGLQIDTDHKDEMRNLIIKGGPFSDTDKENILKYCESDVKYLPKLFKVMWTKYFDYLKRAECRSGSAFENEVFAEVKGMARYAGYASIIEQKGQNIDVPAVKLLTESIPRLLRETCSDVNDKLEGVLPFSPFVWDKKDRKFKRQEKLLQEYIAEEYKDSWKVWTEGGAEGKNKKPSLSEEAFAEMGADRHNHKPTLIDQLYRVVLLNQSINGFKPVSGLQEVGTEKQKRFSDFLGSDGRARPYMGLYGSQSSRSQAGAAGFIFLKSAMFRGLVAPKEGKVIIGADFSQQEILIAALLSGDKKMIDAYRSGDVYVYFAKEAKAMPREGTKATHPEIRNIFKSVTLGTNFGLGAKGMAAKITMDTGKVTTVDEAKRLIDLFYSTFSTYATWRKDLMREYQLAQTEGSPHTIRLSDGWRMLGDNNNILSVANMPVQGTGAVTMRQSVMKAMDDGLQVIMTLHDAVYIETDLETWKEGADKLFDAMSYGFTETFRKHYKGKLPEWFLDCRNEASAWSPSLENGKEVTPNGHKIKTQPRYFDERCLNKDGSLKPDVKKFVDIIWPEVGDGLEDLDL